MAFARVSASRWFPYDRGGPSSLFFPCLPFFFSCLLHQPPTLWGNFFLTPRPPPPPARRPFALPGYQLYPRGPHVATVDPPVCVSHLHEGGPGARLVIPRRGRRNPCVRSLRSYKVQFKKILSSLVSTARSRYTLPSRFSLVFPHSSDKSRDSRYPSTPLAFDIFRFFFLNRSAVNASNWNLYAWLKREYENIAFALYMNETLQDIHRILIILILRCTYFPYIPLAIFSRVALRSAYEDICVAIF